MGETRQLPPVLMLSAIVECVGRCRRARLSDGEYRTPGILHLRQLCGNSYRASRLTTTADVTATRLQNGIRAHPSVRPDRFDHVEQLAIGAPSVAPTPAGEAPDPRAVRSAQGDQSAVEAQTDVGARTAGLEDIEGEPHDRRRVIDAELVSVATESDFAYERGCIRCCGHLHSAYSSQSGSRIGLPVITY